MSDDSLIALPDIEGVYHALLDAMSEGAMVQGVDGQVLALNGAAENIFACSANGILQGESEFPWTVLREDESPFPPAELPWMKTLGNGQPRSDVVMGIRRADQSLVWISANTRPLYAAGEVDCQAVLTVFREVTHGHWVEDLIRQAQTPLDNLFEAIPNPFFIKDRDGRYLGCNSAFEVFLGLKREQIAGKTDHDIAPKELADRHFEADQALLAHPGSQVYEAKVRWAQGPLRDALVHKATIVGPDGRVRALTGSIVDITESKQIERAMQQSERQYRTLVEHSPDMIVRYDTDLRGIYVNPAWERTSGLSAEEVVNLPPEDIPKVPRPVARKYVAALREALAKGTRHAVDFTWENARGETLELQYVVVPECDQEGKVVSLLSVGRDVTEYKRTQGALREREAHLRRVNRALRALSAGNEALVRATSEQQLLEQTCQVIINEGGHRLAAIDYVVQGDAVLEHRAGAGVGATDLDLYDYVSGTAKRMLPGTIEQGIPYVIREVSYDPLCSENTERFQAAGINSGVILPLRCDGASLGVLSIYSANIAAFDDDEVTLLAEMGDDLAYGVHAIRNRAAREQDTRRIQATMEETIQALASTVEFRDPYTAGHQRRVAQLSRAIGHEFGLEEDRINGLYLASVVHDIGKIRVPAEILTQPGRLSSIEYDIVKAHVDAGYDILRSIDFPWPIADTVLQHHERMDGSGYPHGISGEKLLLESRILAVADVVEAIASFRPYRPALGVDFALAEIKHGRGTLFDSDVVDCCVRLFKEKRFEFE